MYVCVCVFMYVMYVCMYVNLLLLLVFQCSQLSCLGVVQLCNQKQNNVQLHTEPPIYTAGFDSRSAMARF
jgi:hypothetical protein